VHRRSLWRLGAKPAPPSDPSAGSANQLWFCSSTRTP